MVIGIMAVCWKPGFMYSSFWVMVTNSSKMSEVHHIQCKWKTSNSLLCNPPLQNKMEYRMDKITHLYNKGENL